MIEPIKLTRPVKSVSFDESFSLDPIKGRVEEASIFTEAVFTEGKKTLQPLVDQFQVVKDELTKELDQHKDKKITFKFDPEKFIKNSVWKELEDRMTKIFGLRNINILHWSESFNSKTGEFQSTELNCFTWPTWRYPIDGLVTDKGFYDSTHSINTEISFSLGIINKLDADELVAVLLHELGHNIDPALVDINYTKTNVLSKYLTDRKDKISNQEKKIVGYAKGNICDTIMLIIYGLMGLIFVGTFLRAIFKAIRDLCTFNEEKAKKKIKSAIMKDKSEFSRKSNGEAYADNFARMYGFGPQLISGLNKMGVHTNKNINSRISNERIRQIVITNMVVNAIKDTHKTNIHRAYNLIKEYKADLADPKIPKKVKEGIKEDLEELEKVVDVYTNENGKFNKMVVDTIKESLTKKDAKNDKDNTLKTESVLFTECIEPYEEMALVDEATLRPLNIQEKLIARRIFGNVKCNFMHDKNGYFAVNARARTSFYRHLEDIPKEKVSFVSTLGRESERLA